MFRFCYMRIRKALEGKLRNDPFHLPFAEVHSVSGVEGDQSTLWNHDLEQASQSHRTRIVEARSPNPPYAVTLPFCHVASQRVHADTQIVLL